MRGAFPTLLVTSIKAYYRNRSAIFFSLLVPLMLMIGFGLLNLGGGNTSERVGVVDQAHNAASKQIVDNLKKMPVLKLSFGTQAAETAALKKGERAIVVVLPAELSSLVTCPAGSPATCKPGLKPVNIPIFQNQTKPQGAQVARAIVSQFLDQASFAALGQPGGIYRAEVTDLAGLNTTYTDFLVPGVIALSIMFTGVFSVAYAFVQHKQNGTLRRLMATPMKVSEFLAAQVTTRLIMAAVQVVILLAVAILVFHIHVAGNILELLIASILGSAVFIAAGFAISGYAKNEQSVPAIANLIVLPMTLLCGVFIPRDALPGWLHRISDFLPLTYVTDALRAISLDGSHLWNIGHDMLGIFAWLVIAVVLAIRLFRWEVA
jgi:ABC-2 type transport system permease protein